MTHERLALGRFGEDAAGHWYEERGFVVAARNYRSKTGEIDLICARGSTVVFVEVKTRTTSRFGGGVAAVNHRKQGKIRGVALSWLASSGTGFDEIRFDVVEVDGAGNVVVWEAAF